MSSIIQIDFTTNKEYYSLFKDDVNISKWIYDNVYEFDKNGLIATVEVEVESPTKVGFEYIIVGNTLGDIDDLTLREIDVMSIDQLEGYSKGDDSGYYDFLSDKYYIVERPRKFYDLFIKDSNINGTIKITLV